MIKFELGRAVCSQSNFLGEIYGFVAGGWKTDSQRTEKHVRKGAGDRNPKYLENGEINSQLSTCETTVQNQISTSI